jgi:hypothetical protein
MRPALIEDADGTSVLAGEQPPGYDFVSSPVLVVASTRRGARAVTSSRYVLWLARQRQCLTGAITALKDGDRHDPDA